MVDAAHYTADLTPPIGSTTPVTVNVTGGAFTDSAGNDNTAATQLVMTVDTVSTATWSISGPDPSNPSSSSVTEGNAASYAVHLAGTLQAGETATIDLAVVDISTTSADYANFAAAVIAAIGARTDLSFNAGTGTLTYTGTGNPMPDLVINLGAVSDNLVEGSEAYKVVLNNPGSTTVSSITLGTSEVVTLIADANTATWSLSGDTGVTEGNAASYTVHLDGTLQAGETATINLAIANVSTTSADYANFATAVQTAITGRTDLSFNAGTGTLTYTGTGSPMPNLVISLGAINDGLVEGPEQYTVSLSSPGSTTGSNVVGSGSVQTIIADANTATWSLSGDTGVTEGNAASYTVHLDGTLQAGETATINLAIANVSTTSADYANFATAVQSATTCRSDLSFNAGTGTLTYTGTGNPMPDLVISLGAINDGLVEGPEQYTVSLSSPGSTTGSNVVGSGSVQTIIADANTATWALSGDTGVTEGNAASYTVHLDGTLQAGETATINLAIANVSTTSADYANFATAVQTAIAAYNANPATSGTLSYVGGVLTFTSDGTGTTPGTMSDLVINLAAVNDGLPEGAEQYSVGLSNPGSTTGANVVGTGLVTTTIIQPDIAPVVDLNGAGAGNNNTVTYPHPNPQSFTSIKIAEFASIT